MNWVPVRVPSAENKRSDPLMSQTIGSIVVSLYSVLLDKPVSDPGYDFLFDEAFVVETADDIVVVDATYGDYETALNRYEREVAYYATVTAKKALKLS